MVVFITLIAEDIIAHPELYKGYDDVDEMMKDILKNV